ncbi:MAG: HAD family phosphatase [Chloroflexi bacterium]|jgi:2-haloacid dehalogenase|nr:HAD family phosphatase [Chloroflexota bacterium]BCY16345.1 hydrolase [Leptolinea sp. HRD-7]
MFTKYNNSNSPAIVFDFGGVLMDWNPHYLFDPLMGNDPDLVEKFLQEIDFTYWNERFDEGRPFAEGTAELTAKFPHYAHLIRAYDEQYTATVRGCNQPVVDILVSLKNRGYPLYGLSNWSIEKFSEVRKGYPFFDLFDDMVISGMEKCIKPGADIFQILLKRASRLANDCLFIDDNPGNIEAAKSLGFQTIHFRSAAQLRDELVARRILD